MNEKAYKITIIDITFHSPSISCNFAKRKRQEQLAETITRINFKVLSFIHIYVKPMKKMYHSSTCMLNQWKDRSA